VPAALVRAQPLRYQRGMPGPPVSDDVVAFVIDGDELVGQGGFLAIRRLRMRNRRADGST